MSETVSHTSLIQEIPPQFAVTHLKKSIAFGVLGFKYFTKWKK